MTAQVRSIVDMTEPTARAEGEEEKDGHVGESRRNNKDLEAGGSHQRHSPQAGEITFVSIKKYFIFVIYDVIKN